ncbi:hypothetical protein SETIT_8G157400v2 [Setaria italica]|uniref:Receptor kinase-like protein Xa21 n=1 Tax=Setaria italica TaxID=4555 RepID=A0A368S859_SETIT|nr:receptor kinase-like protein Xa21 [Setaria italica]RCV38619.1 hypothetical protein SETIT_8G157400v2 [Setaria italica]
MEGRTRLLLLSLLFLFSHARLPPRSRSSSNTTADELALLSFKSMLSGPSALLASWNTSTNYCTWPGVACSRRPPVRVVSLLMNSFNLSGKISPFVGNLSFLEKLNLGNNQLIGEIPPELGRLAKLQLLNLSANSLEGSIPATIGRCTELKLLCLTNNKLQGEIPTEIGNLKNLLGLFLFTNAFSGEIPQSLTELPSMVHLTFYDNKLSGEIPASLSNLTNLQFLGLGKNMLTGSIPSSLGLLPTLSWLDLGFNNLSGVIPTSLWNISSLVMFSVSQNIMLSGTIPPNAFNNLPHLQKIYMDNNQFHGQIPASIANASELEHVQLGYNLFSGIVPPEIGRLRNLSWLELSQTMLEAKEPKDWEFLTALTNCSQLRILDMMFCRLGGVLPNSVSNLSTSLEILFLGHNPISGSIPRDIGNLFNLQIVDFAQNNFTGTIPSSFSRLTNLQGLTLYGNKFSGPISTIGNLTELTYLYLGANGFSGGIPNTLGNLKKLLELDLSRNNFTGSIPNALFNIPTLSEGFDLSYNNLEGDIPQEIGNLKNLVQFHAEFNKLSGQIPSTLGDCQLLQSLYLQNNFLSGNIPSLLGQLKGLENLDLSSNNLSGQIPKFLGDLRMLYYLNVSFNNFIGEVPSTGVFANSSGVSVQGNGRLCGGIPDLHLPLCSLQLPKKKHKLLAVPIVISIAATLAILSSLYILLTWHRRSKTKTPSTMFMPGHPCISYSQLVKATDSFSPSNLLGSGSFGSVYKGELDDQDGESRNLVAVKVLKLQTPGALKSFIVECEALRNMRHRNLVKIVTTCASIDSRGNDFKAIVYDFMPNGSLEGWLHPDANDEQTEQRYLDLAERVTILLDVAYALDYLHSDGPVPVIHCDLKSSNVLLDADMVAHVGDFGLAKIIVDGSLIVQQSVSSMGFRGTIGYAAPEYGAGNVVSTNGDIYSYGILVLEMVTGRRPTDSTFREGLSLREYVELALHNGTMDVIDTRLSLSLENEFQGVGEGDSSQNRKTDCLIALLKLGLSCSEELPSSRMPTADIIRELLVIKGSIL